MIKWFMKIRSDVIEACQDENSDLLVDETLNFSAKVEMLLAELDTVTKSLQSKGYTLASCCNDLSCLFESIAIVMFPSFHSGVIKIQNGLEHGMTESEKPATIGLKKSTTVRDCVSSTR